MPGITEELNQSPIFQIFAHVGHRLRKKITDSKIRDMDSTLPLYGFPFYKLASGKISKE